MIRLFLSGRNQNFLIHVYLLYIMTEEIIAYIIILLLNIARPSWVTFYGKPPVILDHDLRKITVFWNAFATQEKIDFKMRGLINEILLNEDYDDFLIFFKSGYDLSLGKQIYIIKFFRTDRNKTDFLERLNYITSSRDFNARWLKLNKGMKIEDVIILFPEIMKGNIKLGYFDKMNFTMFGSSVLVMKNIKMKFGNHGKLKRWKIKKTGNYKASSR